MYYIQESDKPSKIAELFNIVKLENNNIILPNLKTSMTEKVAYKLAIKTKTILDKTNSKKIVLSKKLKQQTTYMNYLYSYNYEIVDGRWLFQILIFDILEYVIKKLKIKEDDIIIGILVNDMSTLALYVIKQLVVKYKHVKIVTNHINLLRNMEDSIFEEYGIFMNVGNNKRKILSKTNIILNLDFPTELINRYNIYNDATIVNFKGNVKIKDKRFNGLNINNYEIEWPNIFHESGNENEKLNLFYVKEIYETTLHKNQPIEEILKKIKKDNIRIKELIAVNTTI